MDDMNERPRRHDAPDADLADAGRPLVSAGSMGSTGWDAAGDGSGAGPLSLVDADLEPDLAAFLERSTEVLTAAPDEFTAHRHLAAMREMARPRSGARFGLRIASVAAVVALAVMTLAGFGALPAPAQQVIADVADRMGLTIPSPTEADPPAFDLPTQQLPVPEHVPAQPGAPDQDDLPGGLTDDVGDVTRRGDVAPSDQDEVPSPGTDGPDHAPGEPPVDPTDPPDGKPEPPPGPSEGKPEPPSDPPHDTAESPPDPPEPPADPPGSPPDPPGEEPGAGESDDRP
jgi:hypothetical protein